VRLAHYPDLGRATYETPITITGRIAKAGVGEVHLDDAVLSFPDTDSRREQEAAEKEERARRDREFDERLASMKQHADDLAHADALLKRLFTLAPMLQDLPYTKPVAVVEVGNGANSRRVAADIRAYLQVNKYALRPEYAFYPSPSPDGVSLTDQGDYLTIVVNVK